MGQRFANGDDRSDEAKSLCRQVAKLRHHAMHGQNRSAPQRIARLEVQLGRGTQAEVQAAIATERRRGLSRPLVAAIASARLPRWW
jgi:hypothetical protein